MTAPALDPAVLDGLRSLERTGSPGFLRELFEVFLKEGASMLATLRCASSARDAALLAQTAHTLTGSSGLLGALPMSALCAGIEALARRTAWPEADRALEELEAEFRRVRSAMAAVESIPSSAQSDQGCRPIS